MAVLGRAAFAAILWGGILGVFLLSLYEAFVLSREYRQRR